MVFKGRFFSSKKSDSSSPDGSNSPRSFGSNSPSEGEWEAAEEGCEGEGDSGSGTGEAQHFEFQVAAALDVKEAAPSSSAAAVSPILASSLGLHRIKTTRSGPLPQESFFGFRGDKGSALGASNLSRPSGGVGGDGRLSSGSGSKSSVKKKEGVNQSRIGSQEQVLLGNWADTGSNSDGMSSESAPSRDQSPHVQVRSRLPNGESSSEVGMTYLQSFLPL
ncbi:hypothetical protein CK203_004167 [Vitis vinifera]|uniref:Uncharacterized protein n=1 Tax=Vitis vinifera TaxID=29760 RepID=A0A438K9E9_VITVI|nr:hypothetical protein CK203_004167 [Vitis vinifera]